MSSDIWTRCAGDSEIRPLRLRPWRVVESQHQVATRRLVDTLDEQVLLEKLIDSAKPPDNTRGRQHYLLSTPFRYPPLPYGSRFGSAHERGIWYGAESVATAMAEVAYYRLVFLEGTTAELGRVSMDLSAFRASARTPRGVRLTLPPFAEDRARISSPVSYAASQPLGAAMREASVELCTFHSARDPMGGVNIAAFTPRVFGRSEPRDFQSWRSLVERSGVEMVRRDAASRDVLEFPRKLFLVKGKLPMPGLGGPIESSRGLQSGKG